MTRQEKLEDLGNIYSSNYNTKFIVPLPHNFYDNHRSIFSKIQKKENSWEILNYKDDKERLQCFGTFNIKTYINDNMFSHLNEFNENEFMINRKTVILKKDINQSTTLIPFGEKDKKYDLTIETLELWIFDEHIAFFVYNINSQQNKKFTLDEISIINRLLRSHKFLSVNYEDNNLILNELAIKEGEQTHFLKHFLLEHTFLENRNSFLNITVDEIMNKEKKLFTIYNSSSNAKFLAGIELDSREYSNKKLIEEFDPDNINHFSANEMSILEELPYYIASTSSLKDVKPRDRYNDSYIYNKIQDAGFSIWKYSTGVTLHDSCAIVGVSSDGGPVISNVRNSFYFIYMLNLYIGFQIRFIENNIIDQEFNSVRVNHWYKSIQKLKNQFVSDDIAVKFQENEFHQSVFKALNTDQLLNEVFSNVQETKSITDNNIKIYLAFIAFITLSIFENRVNELADNYPWWTLAFTVIGAYVLYKYAPKIKRILKL